MAYFFAIFCESSLHQLEFFLFLVHVIETDDVTKKFAVAGVYFAENLNRELRKNWKSFSTQNYFDSNGVFLSTLWSGPLLVIAMIILINTLFSLCYLIVKWKRAELRHRARLAHTKEE